MTPFASVALFKRNGNVVFRPPRREHQDNITQARKAASRYWAGRAKDGEALHRVMLVREIGGKLDVSDRLADGRDWRSYELEPSIASREPHLLAVMAELGINPGEAPPLMPDVLTINGYTYRRDI